MEWPEEPRFWPKVDKRGPDECWPWAGATNTKGYGLLWVRAARCSVAAQRIAWRIHHGTEVPPGAFVLHRCDNPPCVNPAHLFLGGPGDNARDMARKGRSTHGTKNHNAKLSEAQVSEARKLHAEGHSGASIARRFGMSPSQMRLILRGKGWQRVS